MRPYFLLLLVVVGFLSASHVKAQTWEHPILLAYTAYAAYAENTCPAGNTILNFDGFYSPGPDAVYQLFNRRPVGQPVFQDTVLDLIPPYYAMYPAQDFEVWVCQMKYGVDAEDCPLEADNVYAAQGQPIQLTIPAAYKAWHIVVTTGNSDNPFNQCIPYTLVVHRLQ